MKTKTAQMVGASYPPIAHPTSLPVPSHLSCNFQGILGFLAPGIAIWSEQSSAESNPALLADQFGQSTVLQAGQARQPSCVSFPSIKVTCIRSHPYDATNIGNVTEIGAGAWFGACGRGLPHAERKREREREREREGLRCSYPLPASQQHSPQFTDSGQFTDFGPKWLDTGNPAI